MEILEFIKKAEGGKIIIDIPENLTGKELRIQISEPIEKPVVKRFNEMPIEQRLNYLMQFYGTAKYPDFSITKYDVYDQ